MRFEQIHIEVTSRCNFSCEFCPSSTMTRIRGDMDYALLCKALDEISHEELTEWIMFHVMGEPLLYPKLVDAVKYAKINKLKVCLITNGAAFTETLLDELLEADIDKIVFSVQTPDKRSFNLRKANIHYEEYKKCITSSIAKIVESAGNATATLSFLTTPLRSFLLPSKKYNIISTKAELAQDFMYWLQDIIGFLSKKDLRIKLLGNMDRIKSKLSKLSMFGWNKLLLTDKLTLESRMLGDWIHPALYRDKFKKAIFGCCEGLTRHFGILWNGDMVFCCVDFDGHTRFANLKESSIKDAFHKEDVTAVIKGFKKLRIIHPYCQRCLGDISFSHAFMRQLGSIAYFKLYRKWWEVQRSKKRVLIT